MRSTLRYQIAKARYCRNIVHNLCISGLFIAFKRSINYLFAITVWTANNLYGHVNNLLLRMPHMNNNSILFIGERSVWSEMANAFIEEHFRYTETIFWNTGDKKIDQLDQWRGDWIISFKADLILKPKHLSNASKGAINFHPAPPHYRGIGGYTYALYNEERNFGVTCHHMIEEIDAGKIIYVKRFPILPFE